MGYSANSHPQPLNENVLRIRQPGLNFIQYNALIHKANKLTFFVTFFIYGGTRLRF